MHSTFPMTKKSCFSWSMQSTPNILSKRHFAEKEKTVIRCIRAISNDSVTESSGASPRASLKLWIDLVTPLFWPEFPIRETQKTDSLSELGRAMPTVWFIPRGAEYRYYYNCLERYFIGKYIKTLSLLVLTQCFVLFRQGSVPSAIRWRKLLSIIGTALCIKSLHDQMTKKYVGTFYPTQCMQSFNEDLFFKSFRREHFYPTKICSSKASGENIFIKCWLRCNRLAINRFSAEEWAQVSWTGGQCFSADVLDFSHVWRIKAADWASAPTWGSRHFVIAVWLTVSAIHRATWPAHAARTHMLNESTLQARAGRRTCCARHRYVIDGRRGLLESKERPRPRTCRRNERARAGHRARRPYTAQNTPQTRAHFGCTFVNQAWNKLRFVETSAACGLVRPREQRSQEWWPFQDFFEAIEAACTVRPSSSTTFKRKYGQCSVDKIELKEKSKQFALPKMDTQGDSPC